MRLVPVSKCGVEGFSLFGLQADVLARNAVHELADQPGTDALPAARSALTWYQSISSRDSTMRTVMPGACRILDQSSTRYPRAPRMRARWSRAARRAAPHPPVMPDIACHFRVSWKICGTIVHKIFHVARIFQSFSSFCSVGARNRHARLRTPGVVLSAGAGQPAGRHRRR